MTEDMEKLARLNVLIKQCARCKLSQTRTKIVIGEGGFNKKIMFIGEAPGANEDLKGRPFVGRSGELLDKLLSSIGLTRKDIYITNIVKCRPPHNRNPNQEEIKSCQIYLIKQIEILKPRVICTLGRFSTEFIFEKYNLRKTTISRTRGNPVKVNSLFPLIIFPMYHPAAALYNPNLRKILENDFKNLRDIIKKNENNN